MKLLERKHGGSQFNKKRTPHFALTDELPSAFVSHRKRSKFASQYILQLQSDISKKQLGYQVQRET